jgi:hypothetical protein
MSLSLRRRAFLFVTQRTCRYPWTRCRVNVVLLRRIGQCWPKALRRGRAHVPPIVIGLKDDRELYPVSQFLPRNRCRHETHSPRPGRAQIGL